MRRASRLGVLAAGLALIAAAPASAHHPKPKPVKVETVTGGLDNPRHVAVAKNGDVWVAESGRGAPAAESNSCFNSAEGAACTGDSGAITRINRWGAQRVVTGLASFAPESGDFAIGPHGVFADGNDDLLHQRWPDGAVARRRSDQHRPAQSDAGLGGAGVALLRDAAHGRAVRQAPRRDRRPMAVRAQEQPGCRGRQPADRLQPRRRVGGPRPLLRRRRRRQHRAARQLVGRHLDGGGVRRSRDPQPVRRP